MVHQIKLLTICILHAKYQCHWNSLAMFHMPLGKYSLVQRALVWTKPASHYWCKLGFEGRYKHLDCNRGCSYLKKLKKRQSITMLQRCNCIKQFFRKHFRSNWSWKDLLHSSSHIWKAFWFWKAFLKYWEPENHYKYIQAIGYEQRPAIYFTKTSQEPENIQVIQKGCRMGVTGNQEPIFNEVMK